MTSPHDASPTGSPAGPPSESVRDWGPGLNRRSFLKTGGVSALSAAAALAASRPAAAARPAAARAQPFNHRRGGAMNLIMLVSDGMSAGAFALADMFIRQRDGAPSRWAQFMEQPGVVRSSVRTESANSYVTDSAAAGSAWGIGEQIDNGRIGLTPDGRTPSPLLLRAREAGKATGLVTTTRITHATPAGFACNVANGSRGDEERIARQLLDRRYDLLLGGGGRFLTQAMAEASGARFVRTRAQLRSATPSARDRLVGIFADSHMAYELDRTSTEPSLADMTTAALGMLAPRSGGFVLQIEGGRVDHAAHANDAGGLIYDQAAFDQALGVALDWALGRDDTLVIATTDHGNANPGLTDYLRPGIMGFEKIHGWSHSFEWIFQQLESLEQPSRPRLLELVRQATGITMESAEVDMLLRWRAGERVDPFVLANGKAGPLGSVIANHTRIAFLSPNHTSDHVELTAWGPGSAHIPPTSALHDLHDHLTHALDLPPAANL